jgi:hypothetical protein
MKATNTYAVAAHGDEVSMNVDVAAIMIADLARPYDAVAILRGVEKGVRGARQVDGVTNQGYLSWNRPDTSWPNLRPRSKPFTFAHSASCTYVYLVYIYLLVYSLGQSTQFSYAVVEALSTAIDGDKSQ